MRVATLRPQFVDSVPDVLEEGVLYISQKYATVLHKCCCGCGLEVATPLSPATWQLKNEGGQVTLAPSIGNWNFPCKSHYWIRRNDVQWSPQMSERQIARVRALDRRDIEHQINKTNEQREAAANPSATQPDRGTNSIWVQFRDFIKGIFY